MRQISGPGVPFGSGAPIGVTGRGADAAGTAWLRLAGLLALLAAVALAFGVSPAAAFETHSFKASFRAPASDVELSLAANSGLAVNEPTHDVYVADTGNHRIVEFSEAGTFLRAFGADVGGAGVNVCTTGCLAGISGTAPGAFEAPTFVAVDGEGDVYVADTVAQLVSKFDADGNLISSWGNNGVAEIPNGQLAGKNQTEPFASIAGIAVDSIGTLDVFAVEPHALYKFARAGTFTEEVETPRGTFPSGLAIGAAGNFFKVNGDLSVEKFADTGADIGQVSLGEGGAERAFGIAIDSSNGDLFADIGASISAYAFNGSGEVLESAGTTCPPAEFAGCHPSDSFGRGNLSVGAGVAVDATSGTVYVADSGAAEVDAFGPLTLPDATTDPATGIGPHEVTLHGTISAADGPEASCEFQYTDKASFEQQGFGAAVNLGCTPPGPFTGSGEQAVSALATGLAGGTEYVFRLRATNENGANPKTATAGGLEFHTTGPLVATESVSDVSATAASLEAEINPNGLPTAYHFDYGTTTAYGTSSPTVGAGAGVSAVLRTAQVQGLQPLTTYHFRVVAENDLGTSDGPDVTFATQGAAAALLPDGREWEMVTPPNKHGSPLEPLTEEGGVVQAAADGSAFTEVALGPLGPEAAGVRSPTDNQWLSNRGTDGWSTRDITTPREEISIFSGGFPSEYKFFSEDLSAAAVEPQGSTPLSPETTERTPYRRESSGGFVPLVTTANVPAGTKFGGHDTGGGQFDGGVKFLTATPELHHVILTSPQILTTGFSSGFEPNGQPNLYELSGGALSLISVLPSGEPSSEAGEDAGLGNSGTNNVRNYRGAISRNGQRVVFETSGEHLYLRDVGLRETLLLDERQPGGAGGPGVAEFQAANEEASKVFFTDGSRLTEDSGATSAEPDLYMCEIEDVAGHLGCSLSDLSVDPNPGEAADVEGLVSAIDSTGKHVYFAANGVLTNTPNAEHEVALPGNCEDVSEATCNLYVYDTETAHIRLVAVLSSHDDPDWTGRTSLNGLGNLTARSSPEGRWFTFMSRRPLTGYDNRDVGSGERDEEVFLYDAANGLLHCASCNPTGGRPRGVFDAIGFPGLLVDHPATWGGKNAEARWLAASIPGWTLISGGGATIALNQSRYLSNSGRLFFNSSDALVPQDTNGVNDVYEYEPPGVGDCTTSSPTYGAASGGCVGLISSGTSPEESAFLDASESGDDVFFLTQSRLSSTDVDGAYDVYDAHACSASSPCTPQPPPPPPACEGDACQQPATPPVDATPGSLTFSGAGNVVQCPKGKVKKQGKCVKKKTKAKAKKHRKHHKKSKGQKKSAKKGHAGSDRKAGR